MTDDKVVEEVTRISDSLKSDPKKPSGGSKSKPKPTNTEVKKTVEGMTFGLCTAVGILVDPDVGAEMLDRSKKFTEALTFKAQRSSWLANLIVGTESAGGWALVAAGAWEMTKPLVEHYATKPKPKREVKPKRERKREKEKGGENDGKRDSDPVPINPLP